MIHQITIVFLVIIGSNGHATEVGTYTSIPACEATVRNMVVVQGPDELPNTTFACLPVFSDKALKAITILAD